MFVYKTFSGILNILGIFLSSLASTSKTVLKGSGNLGCDTDEYDTDECPSFTLTLL